VRQIQADIHRFNSANNVTEDEQLDKLLTEVAALCQYSADATDGDVEDQLSNVIFLARSLAELRDINISSAVEDTIKTERYSEQKTTKSTVSHPSYSYGSTGTKLSETDYGVTDD